MLKKSVFNVKLMLTLGITLCLPISSAKAVQIDDVKLNDSIQPFKPEVRVLGHARNKDSVEFHVALKMRNLDELQSRIDEGEVISAQELEQLYHPTKEDHDKVVKWLRNQGFSVKTYQHGLVIVAQGSADQVQSTLGVNLQQVLVEGKTYLATEDAPNIPGSLSDVVLGINGLQPHLRAKPHLQNVQRLSVTTPFAPAFSINDLKVAYGVNKVALNGSGQRMGIVIDVFPNNNDLTTFWKNQNIPQSLNNIEKVCTGSTAACNSTPSGEETLDVEMTSGLAPAGKVRIYGTGSLSFSALDTAYAQILSELQSGTTQLQQVSLSYGACEQAVSNSQLRTDSQFFASLVARGVTVFASSGDSGSSNNCSSSYSSKVSYPASDVNVTSVGGTSVFLSSRGAVTNETGWGGSGGGTSSFFKRPTWQVGTGVPAGTQRLVPDVSLVADPNTGVYVYLNGNAYQFGGTSVSAPLWNALTALINQNRRSQGKSSLGLLGPKVYPLINTLNISDISSGNNGQFSAGRGYDQVTGVGVPVFDQLLNPLSQ